MSRREITAGKAVIVVDLVDRATANFSKISSKMMTVANGFREIGRMSAGGALLSGIVSNNVLSRFTAFEDQMLNLTAKLGYFGKLTVQQQRNIDSLRQTIIGLAKSTSYTSKEVADAAVSLAQAGFTVTEIRSSLQSVLDLARGTGYSLGETADLLANTVRTFNMFKPGDGPQTLADNMSTVAHVASMMVKATRLGTIEIQDLRESFKYAGGTANNLGAKLPTILGLLVQMSESGLKASLAGTSMGTAFQNLAQNMVELQGRAKGFKVFREMDGSVDFTNTFKSLMDATKNMDKMEKTILFQDIFNIRGGRMVSSVQDMERVEYFIREIAGAGNEARQSAAMMESGLGGAIRRLTSALDALTIAWGYTFKDGATAIANFATVGVDFLEKLTVKYKALIAGLVVSPIIFAGVAVAAFTLSAILSKLTYVVFGLGAALGGLKFVGGKMAGSIMSLASPIKAMRASRSAILAERKSLQEKVAKQGAAIDARIAKAQTAKNPAKAMGKIFQSKSYQKYLSLAMKSQAMGKSFNPLDAMDKALLKYVNSSKQARAITRGLVATMGIMFRVPIANGRELFTRLNNIKGALIAITQQAKNLPSTMKKLALTLSAKIPTKSRSLSGLQGLFSAANQARSGLATGNVSRLLNTTQLRNALSTLKGSTLTKSVTGLFKLSSGFLRLSMSMTRFVFSWNFVGLVFNALLLFGDKIKVVRDVFTNFGKGFADAFQQIGRIATYAAPAINLFRVAFDAFLSGNTKLGVEAVVFAFQGLVGIIGNQLYAAWNAFAARVEYIWLTIVQIGTAIWAVVDALISGAMSAAGSILSPLSQGIKDLNGGAGAGIGGTIIAAVGKIGQTLSWFISEFFKAVITFREHGNYFLNRLQRTMGHIINALPGTGNAGKNLIESADANDALDGLLASKLRADINFEQKERQKTLSSIMSTTAEQLQKQRIRNVTDANNRSGSIFEELAKGFAAAVDAQVKFMANKAAFEEQQKMSANQMTPSTAVPNGAKATIERFALRLEAVVGSISSASKSRFLVDTPKMIDQQKLTNDKLDELINTVKTNTF